MKETKSDINLTLKNRASGAFVGLAAGDALGTTLEFKSKGSFTPIIDMNGGGPFNLIAGQWTDDTSMALCLADSLLINKGFYPVDQLERYCAWQDEGYRSATGHCFDIGCTVRAALNNFKQTKESYPGASDEYSAGNGSLMRLAPVVLYYFSSTDKKYQHENNIQRVMNLAMLQSRTTHAEQRAVQACAIYSLYLYKALLGQTKYEILNSTIDKQYISHNIGNGGWHDDIKKIIDGSYIEKEEDKIFGTGFVVDSLEAALWCFYHSDSFEQGALMAANLGDDADTTAAIYGQLAGAFYGLNAIPKKWRNKLYCYDEIVELSEKLIQCDDTPPSIDEIIWLSEDLYSEISTENLPSNTFYRFIARCHQHSVVSSRYNWVEEVQYFQTPESSNDYLQQNGIKGFCTLMTGINRSERFNEGITKLCWQNKTIQNALIMLRDRLKVK